MTGSMGRAWRVPGVTPLRGDLRAVAPLAMAAVATLIRPASWNWFVADSVRNYALTPEGGRQLLARQQAS